MNALALKGPKSATRSKIESEIEDIERDIDTAEVAAGEEWFHIAKSLKEIKDLFAKAKKKKEEPFGCKTFEEYCRSPRSRYSKRHANRMIDAFEIRRVIPGPTGPGIGWSERSIRPLTELHSTQAQAAAAQAAIADAEKNGKPLGTACKDAVEKAKKTTAYKKAKAKKEAEEEAKTSPGKNLKRLLDYTRKHLQMLARQPVFFWTAAEEEEPGIAVRTAEALEELAAFLRE